MTWKIIVTVTFLLIFCEVDVLGVGIRLYDKETNTSLTTMQIIRKYGYSAEAHTVVTEDGYILGVHRIVSRKNETIPPKKYPILLQHGILGTSADFFFVSPDQILPFLLADRGYDVWLGNMRGNTYSRGHISLSPDTTEFWDYSFHEGGIYDITASIDFILNKTNQEKVFYIGYSLGTNQIMVTTSMRPEYQEKLKGIILLAPTVFLNYAKSPLRVISPYFRSLQLLSEIFAHGEVTDQSPLYKLIIKYTCLSLNIQKKLCMNLLYLVTGFDPAQYDPVAAENLMSHNPAGISAKTFTHGMQNGYYRKFQQYDYGYLENMKLYGRETPPEYELGNVTTPVYMFVGQNDLISSVPDAKLLATKLPNVRGFHLISYPKFSHLDFLLAKDVKALLFDKVLKVISDWLE